MNEIFGMKFMKLKMCFLGFMLVLVSLMFFLNEKVYFATIPLQKVNIRGIWRQTQGYYTTYNNSGSAEILIAIDSQKGRYICYYS